LIYFKETSINNYINKRSRQELTNDMDNDKAIFGNNQINALLLFTFMPKTGTGLPITVVSFYCV